MKIIFDDLVHHSIQKLVICSLDCSLYQAAVVIAGKEHVVWQDEHSCVRSRSLMEMRELFEPLNIQTTVLRHESAYDEMVGQPSKLNGNRMEVPLSQSTSL